MQVATENTWLTRSEALALLQCVPNTFLRLVDQGRIRTRDFGHRRYWAEDVRRLAAPPEATQRQS